MSRRIRTAVLAASILAAGLAAARAATDKFPDDPLTSPRTQWWREAKFGMFIHWGIYSVPAGEWKGQRVPGIAEWIMHRAKVPVEEYKPLAGRFNPVRFDARQWVNLAREAGMRYIVITSKHHDGFSMFDSKLTDYDVVEATPWKHDPMKDLAAACKEAGIRFCFYHSIMDWYRPWQGADMPKYTAFMKGQLKELVEQYGPLGILWFDGEWIKEWDQARGRDLYDYVRGLQGDLIVNNRVGKRKSDDGDYETPEQNIPREKVRGRLWETCMTINGTWGYSKYDENWKPTADLVRKLVDIVSKGGNFLLNVGPTAEGLIPEPSAHRLRQMGAWLKVNGEAIYGASASPFDKEPFDGRTTAKGDTLYLHVFAWPAEGPLVVRGLKGEVAGARALDPAVGFSGHSSAPSPEGTVLSLSRPARPDPYATVIAVRLKAPRP
jgi:alpha-L-fucosidase